MSDDGFSPLSFSSSHASFFQECGDGRPTWPYPSNFPKGSSGTALLGLEQSAKTAFLTGHILWQDRLEKDRKARKKHLRTSAGAHGRVTHPHLPRGHQELKHYRAEGTLHWRNDTSWHRWERSANRPLNTSTGESVSKGKSCTSRGLPEEAPDVSWGQPPKEASSPHAALRAYQRDSLTGHSSIGNVKPAVPLRDHEVTAQQWRAVDTIPRAASTPNLRQPLLQGSDRAGWSLHKKYYGMR